MKNEIDNTHGRDWLLATSFQLCCLDNYKHTSMYCSKIHTLKQYIQTNLDKGKLGQRKTNWATIEHKLTALDTPLNNEKKMYNLKVNSVSL